MIPLVAIRPESIPSMVRSKQSRQPVESSKWESERIELSTGGDLGVRFMRALLVGKRPVLAGYGGGFARARTRDHLFASRGFRSLVRHLPDAVPATIPCMVAASHPGPTNFRGSSHPTLGPCACNCSRAHGGREYQQALAGEVVQALEAPLPGRASRAIVSSALVIVPTGGGKTHLALSIAKTLQDEAGLRIGWCATRRELLRQAAEENRRFGFGVDLRLVSLFDRSPPECDVLMMDEAHHDACTTAASLTAAVRPAFVIGLTATPYRTDRARLSYNHVLRRCSIQSLQDDGFLSQYRHVVIESWEPAKVAAAWLADRDQFGKTVIFFRTAAEGRACLAMLRLARVACELVTGESDRQQQIADFAADRLEVLIAMGCLTEGFNDPSLRTVFVRPASRGPTVQMAGRVFRLHPGIAIKTVVQPQRTPMPMPRIARPSEQYLVVDGEWRSIGATPRLDVLVDSMRRLAASAAPVLPKILRPQRGARLFRPGFISPDRPDQES